MKEVVVEDLLKLSVSERILLVETLWDSIAAAPNDIPLTDMQREELDRRFENYQNNPDAGVSWDEVKMRVKQYS